MKIVRIGNLKRILIEFNSSDKSRGTGETQQESEGPEWRVGILPSLQNGERKNQEKREENLQVTGKFAILYISTSLHPYLQCVGEQEKEEQTSEERRQREDWGQWGH